ncbi:SpvB/TcaC N-terminal domain-containing protein, partial [Xenorhabdus bovienii]|uniref:SpvB/TcaC N-terminal domain-containing protein n=1 Tax=Xenorhabdus bovienii TaxID=40576 RepID=UPI00237CCCAB
LPKGGGTLRGMGETFTGGGPDGMATLSLPLPISSGRGAAPALSLTYSSGSGNGAFGMGWHCATLAVSLRTSHGVPRYEGNDTFLSPMGDVMQVAPNEQGKPDIRITNQLQGVTLDESWQVTRYQPRIVHDFSRLEYWQPVRNSTQKPFWVMFSPEGQVHLFGKNAHARMANPADDSQIAQWLLEETVTPTGEHIYYQYRAEDDAGCDEPEKGQHPLSAAQRYLLQVHYGNITPQASLFALDKALPANNQWLFHLVFDYGERASSLYEVPAFQATPENWPVRQDCFSRFEYGFEIRTRRLCRQVLMFHRLNALAGKNETGEVPALVSRLMLNYDPNHSLSTLVSARQVAHENDGTPVTLPPLELDYQRLDTASLPAWQPMPQLDKFNPLQPYQFVDLYGEGLPGILYQDAPHAWWYRSPMRDTQAEARDAVAYGEIKPLPQIPAQQNNASLMDINGDGKLDWVVTAAGVNGYHTMAPNGQWSPFVPLSALPVEYFHPQAQLADLTGAGLADLVMIGPRSVRLYANQPTGWKKGNTVIQSDGMTLPIPGADARKLVAFADMLGSGQQHLAEIAAGGVTCWPNLGHGRFGQPIRLEGFAVSAKNFNPDQVYLADIDGSGTTDILYVHSTYLELFMNESGNQFAAPVRINLPENVRFDRTCQLHIADTQGLGVSSIILTVPHMTVQHWRLDMTEDKPGLLNTINNNMGAETTLFYRSSAQFWLDEKHQAENVGRAVTSYLPFPVHVLWRTEVLDEITGNRLTSEQDYAHGAWDGREREFRGFGRVSQKDTDKQAQATDSSVTDPLSPAITISWFATGVPTVDALLAEEFWHGDKQAFPPFTCRFTHFDPDKEQDVTLVPSTEEAYWLHQALQGQPLHSEVYGDDGTAQAGIPYTVMDSRPQVRLLTGLPGNSPTVWPSVIEQRTWQYERIAEDPQCHQQVVLNSDRYGFPRETVEIAYPRRPKPAVSPYPDTLPATLFDSSYDDQQQQLRLTRQRQRYHHLTDTEYQVLGLPDIVRSDAWAYPAARVPREGFTLEDLLAENSLIAPGTPLTYVGHQRVAYTGPEEKPTRQALVAYTETAVFDELALQAFNGALSPEALEKKLIESGYLSVPRPFNIGAESAVWVARQGYTDYGGAKAFYRPLAQRTTVQIGKNTLHWDTHYCAVVRMQDAAGLYTDATYDYRFLTPVQITDANDNQQHITLTPLGQVSSGRFWGTEAGTPQGYTPPEDRPFTPPPSVAEALDLKPDLPVANCRVYAPLSWMPLAHTCQEYIAGFTGQTLLDAGVVTEDKRVCALGFRRWVQRQGIVLNGQALADSREPVHVLTLATDRYDTDPEQQLRKSVTYSDGFGRLLQSAVYHAPGEAWQRAADGSLITDAKGAPLVAHTTTRWAVSGRTEYDGKGQPVRTYQPFFLDAWQYLSDDSARQDLYADTHRYDPLGREYQVRTAKGYLRQNLLTPWFVVNEDENDTLS